jgi:hypothetical protein
MLLIEIAQLIEMARPAKICDKCGKSMAGFHYWYKGGWKCKKSSLEGKKDEPAKDDKKPAEKKAAEKPAPKKEAPKKEAPAKPAPAAKKEEGDDDKEHKGVVKGLEREAGEEKDEDVKAAEQAEKEVKKKGATVKAGERISAEEMREIDAETEAEARKQINNTFSKASDEQKARALNVWKARHKKKD